MHDPLSVAHEIRYPWKACRNPKNDFEKKYREPFITIWHKDPETDGSDDSCDWFGSKKTRRNGWYPVHIDEYNQLKEEARQAVDFMWYLWGHRMRPWYRHPKWHVWHWRFQVHPWQTLRRWLFSRCAGCGKRFPWGYCPVSTQWHSEKPGWFRSEKNVYHQDCCPGAKPVETNDVWTAGLTGTGAD